MAAVDTAYFDTVLEEIANEVRRQTGEDASWFTEHVGRRMVHGAELYGELAYLERDNLPEEEDELADCISYPMFELDKLNRLGVDLPEGVHHQLFEVMVGAALLALKVRHVRRQLAQP